MKPSGGTIPEELRWLANNIEGGYMPCGFLRSHFLNTVADRYESLIAEKYGRNDDA